MKRIDFKLTTDPLPAMTISNSPKLEIQPVKFSDNTILGNHELLLKSYPGKLLYSIREASKTLGVSYEFVRSKVYAGHVLAQAFGSRRLIHITELSRLISEGLPS